MAIDPIRLYEMPSTGVMKILSAPIALAIANNTQVVAAVSGSRIRVMGIVAQATGAAAGSFQLKSNSGGTVISSIVFVPPVTAGATFQLPLADSGYYETSTGHGLFVDVVTAAINLNVFYIVYVP